MYNNTNCSHNPDSLKLVRDGTSQEQRFSPALDPAYAPVDERTVAHRMVFAQAYAFYLKYFNSNNTWEGDWQAFFNNDVSLSKINMPKAEVGFAIASHYLLLMA